MERFSCACGGVGDWVHVIGEWEDPEAGFYDCCNEACPDSAFYQTMHDDVEIEESSPAFWQGYFDAKLSDTLNPPNPDNH